MKKAVKLIILFVILAGFFTFGLDKIAEISKDSNNKSLKTVDEIETIYVLDKDVYLQDMTDDCYEQYYQFTADLYTYGEKSCVFEYYERNSPFERCFMHVDIPKGNDSMSFLEGKNYRDHVSAKIIARFDERTVSASQVDDNGNVNIYDIDYHFTLVDANKTINPITQNLVDNNNYEDWIRNVSEGDPVLCMGQVGTIMPNYTFNNSAFILQMYGDIQLLIVGVDTDSLMEEDYVAIYGSYVGRDDSNRAIIEAERGLMR